VSGESLYWVRRYTGEQFSVLPIPRGEKGPRVSNWQNTTFTEEDFGAEDNIGVRLGEPSQGLIDIDLDAKEAITAARSLLLQSQRVHGRPAKPASHYWFRCKGIKTQRFTAPNGDVLVEIRGTGGQTVLPPSQHPSGEILVWEQEREPMQVEPEVLRRSVALVACAALVGRVWPSGSRHEAAGALAGFLVSAGVEPVVIERVVRVVAEIAGDEEAGDRARFAGDTARRAAASAENPVTGATKLGELIGDEVVKRLRSWFGIKADSAVDELNKTLFLVKAHGSDVLVGNETPHGVIFQTAAALRLRYANELVVVGEKKNGDDILKTKFDVWLSSPRRRQVDTVGFYPPPLTAPKDHYNLWRGFAFEPDSKPQPELRCNRYLDHVHTVACSGREEISEWLFDWMADAVQNPGTPAEVAIAMRGAAGAGKGFTARELGSLFGRHFIQLDRTEHLTGKFNAHLSGRVIVFADEAIWAGSKQDLGALKRLITEPTLTIERKGIDATDEANCIHLITATNDGWAVPTMMRERRWLILDVLNDLAQNHAYFSALKMQQEHGGRAALLAWLLARKISCNLRAVPATAEGFEQALRSATPIEQWWFEKLDQHAMFLKVVKEDGRWPEFVASANAHWDYWHFCKRADARPLTLNVFGREWRKLLPADTASAERTCLLFETGTMESKGGVLLPSIGACREHFAKQTKFSIVWSTNVEAEHGELLT
jgi:Bifunctional DNA primase/polymerase, N-terminal/Family of unknown function (DUF5906)